jgi:predicted MFS family arabinose efflux permease
MRHDFRLYWLGQTSSIFGSLFTTTATGLVAVRYLGATPVQTGLLVAAAGVTPLLLGIPIGALADRLDRPRRVLIGCDLTGLAAVGLLAVGLLLHWASIWWLIALNMVLGGVTLVVETVYFIHLRGIVAKDELVVARARLQTGEYGAGVLGRALAGPVVLAAGAAAAFLVDALSYLVSAVSLARLRTPEQPRPVGGQAQPRSAGMFAGLRVTAGHRFLRPVAGYLAVQGLAAGATSALTAQFLIRVLRLPTAIYGLPFLLVGVCGMAGSLAAARLAQRGTAVRTMTAGGFIASTLAAALLPLARGPVALAVILAGLGIALPVFFGAIANVGMTSVLTTEVPEHVLGRAVAGMQTLMTLVTLAGAVGGGVLGDAMGVHPALWLATSVSIAGLTLAVPMVRAGRPVPEPAGPQPQQPQEPVEAEL